MRKSINNTTRQCHLSLKDFEVYANFVDDIVHVSKHGKLIESLSVDEYRQKYLGWRKENEKRNNLLSATHSYKHWSECNR